MPSSRRRCRCWLVAGHRRLQMPTERETDSLALRVVVVADDHYGKFDSSAWRGNEEKLNDIGHSRSSRRRPRPQGKSMERLRQSPRPIVAVAVDRPPVAAVFKSATLPASGCITVLKSPCCCWSTARQQQQHTTTFELSLQVNKNKEQPNWLAS